MYLQVEVAKEDEEDADSESDGGGDVGDHGRRGVMAQGIVQYFVCILKPAIICYSEETIYIP